MAQQTPKYKRLPSSRMASPSRVWLGGDHLLTQGRSLCAEFYRRFYFRDIQAFIVQKTASGTALSAVLGAGIVLLLLLAIGVGEIAAVVILCCCGGFLAVLLVNLSLGPTCRCYLRTAVAVHRLPMITRISTAGKLLAIVAPAIREAQGGASDEEVRLQAAQAQRTRIAPGAPGWVSPGVLVPHKRHYPGTMHSVLCATLLIGCVLSLLSDREADAAWTILAGAVLLVQVGLAIAAAVKQSGSNVPAGLKATVWLTISYVCLVYVMALIRGSLLGTDYESDRLTSFSLQPFAWFSAACSGFLGVTGFLQLAAFRSNLRLRRRAEAAAARETGEAEIRTTQDTQNTQSS